MITAKTKKIKNKILAMSIAEPAIPVNPNNAATIAITKNVAAHRNILPSLPAGRQALFFFFFYNLFTDIFNMLPRILDICSCTSHCVTPNS
jgi:hypothetical protein